MKSLKTKTEGLLNFSDYKSRKYRVLYAIIIILLVFAVLTAILPVLWLFISSFKTVSELNSTEYHLFPEIFNIQKLFAVWEKSNFGTSYLNTLIVVIGSVICAVVFNSLLAYSIAILKPIGYKFLNGLILLGYMIPSVIALYPLVVQIKNLGLINQFTPLWFAFGANAYYYLLFKDYFEKLPVALIEAARVDGLSEIGIFFKIVLPLSKSIMGVVAIFAMTASYSDFILPYTVLKNEEMWTVMVSVYNLTTATLPTLDSSELLMLIIITMIPQIILLIIFQKQIMNSAVNSGMKD